MRNSALHGQPKKTGKKRFMSSEFSRQMYEMNDSGGGSPERIQQMLHILVDFFVQIGYNILIYNEQLA